MCTVRIWLRLPFGCNGSSKSVARYYILSLSLSLPSLRSICLVTKQDWTVIIMQATELKQEEKEEEEGTHGKDKRGSLSIVNLFIRDAIRVPLRPRGESFRSSLR